MMAIDPRDKELSRQRQKDAVTEAMQADEFRSIEDWQKHYLPNGIPEQPEFPQLRASAQARDACQVDKFSSRVCEHGTLSCIVEHATPPSNDAREAGGGDMTDEQLLEHFNIPGLNIEASLEPRELELFLVGVRALLREATDSKDQTP
jgi:hypothetical protein